MDARQLVAQMTLEEKAGLCSGSDYWHTKAVARLGLAAVMVSDGPHGLRKQAGEGDNLGLKQSVPATCFPPAATTANSFDPALVREIGEALAEECLAEGVSVILGPGANIKRSPLCGRNFEYISEDPYLTGQMATGIIDGVQSRGVGTCLKHFAANNQEKFRMVSDSVVDERALREIYLAGFETAVREAKPWSLMCAYNRLNGTYACQNDWLLNQVLRDEWGFDGIVMTDWGAMDQRVPALKAGLELEMPGSQGYNDKRIIAAVRQGTLDEAVLDAAVVRLVEFMQRGLAGRQEGAAYDTEAHNALARRAAAQSAVLLKNENNLLPLKPGAKVAVIGEFAKKPRYQGSGSSKINPTSLDNAWDALLAAGVDAEYAPGYSLESGKPDERLISQACRVAKGKDVVLLFLGLPDAYESEGYDRDNMKLPVAHNQLVNAVQRANPNVAVVLLQGAPVLLPWRGRVPAILATYLGGQAGGAACADVLTGAVNPSGRLAESWPLALEDTPAHLNFPGSPRQVQYRESIFVGYRWYDTAGREVAYPFGHGLSYTSFAYSDIEVSHKTVPDKENVVTVSCKITNTGSLPGSEVLQLYVGKGESKIPRAAKELKAFTKIHLAPGETKTVKLALDSRSFSYYNVVRNEWCIEGGTYTLQLGASSRDIHLSASLTAEGDGHEALLAPLQERAPVYFSPPETGPLRVPDAAFRTVYGKPLPAEHEGRPYTWNSTLHDLKDTLLVKSMLPLVNVAAGRFYGNDAGRSEQMMARSMMLEIPLRAAGLMTGGKITLDQVEGAIDLINRKPVKGVRGMVHGRLKK